MSHALPLPAQLRRLRRRRRLALPGAARGDQLLVSHLAGAARRARAGQPAAGLPAARHRHGRMPADRARLTTTSSSTPHALVAQRLRRWRKPSSSRSPATTIGFVGAHAAVLPAETLKASPAIDWVGRKEFDFTCKEVAEGRPLESIAGLSFRDRDGQDPPQPRARTDPGHGRAAVGGGCLSARS